VIKFFRKIRQRLLLENPPARIGRAGKTGSPGEDSAKAGKPALPVGRYLKYAVGEIILVVIGILIALQLNDFNDNRNEVALGYQFLAEIKSELTDDIFKLDEKAKGLKTNIENHERAMSTKDINALPLDSLYMIITPNNLNFKTSELTYFKMNNSDLIHSGTKFRSP
jgi:hypothetical protein